MSDITAVLAVKNRNEPLAYSIPQLQNIHRIKEIIIGDWSSDIPLQPQPKVKIVRIEDKKWRISKALNMCLQLVETKYVLKIDADAVYVGDNIEDIIPDDGYYIAGDWCNARNQNEKHLTGIISAQIEDLKNIGYYDERLDGYGHDDIDLYARLSDKLTKISLNNNNFYHLPHSQNSRSEFTAHPHLTIAEMSKVNAEVIMQHGRWHKNSDITRYDYQHIAHNYIIANEIPLYPGAETPNKVLDKLVEMVRNNTKILCEYDELNDYIRAKVKNERKVVEVGQADLRLGCKIINLPDDYEESMRKITKWAHMAPHYCILAGKLPNNKSIINFFENPIIIDDWWIYQKL